MDFSIITELVMSILPVLIVLALYEKISKQL